MPKTRGPARRRVAVAGAGLVGSLWAVLLRQKGYDVDLFEKRSDPRKNLADQGRSINLVITSRGIHGLEIAGLLEKALKLSVPVFGRMIHGRDDTLTYQPYGRDGECNHSISRIELNRFLIDAAEKEGARLHFDHALQDVDVESKRLTFQNAAGKIITQDYDLLFGTDGAGSAVRKALAKHLPSKIQESVQWLEADYKELHLPSGPGGGYRIQKDALHIWPRGSHMLMGLANLDGSFTMTLYLPKTGRVSFENVKSEDEVQRLFETEFKDAIPLIPDFTKQFLSGPQGNLGTVRCSSWVLNDSVALLGDAAHAIVPFFGQGMNCGFEDCTELVKLMEQNGDDWSSILKTYEAKRKADAGAIADMALENWVEMRDKVGDPAFQLRKKIESRLETEFPRLYKSRYRLITYTLVPYTLAQAAGRIHDRILDQLCTGISKPEELSLEDASLVVERELGPFLQKHDLHF